VSCEHCHCFNMDEWSDAEGNTVSSHKPGSFQGAMEEPFFEPLGELTVPPDQRHFATRDGLPRYPEGIRNVTKSGGRLIVIYGVGRVCHVAFWEPHFAAEFDSVENWKQDYSTAAKPHPLTIEQNAITSFKSRTTQVSARANTIGPGPFLEADYAIGGCDAIMLFTGLETGGTSSSGYCPRGTCWKTFQPLRVHGSPIPVAYSRHVCTTDNAAGSLCSEAVAHTCNG